MPEQAESTLENCRMTRMPLTGSEPFGAREHQHVMACAVAGEEGAGC
jgi:hypothetical protein